MGILDSFKNLARPYDENDMFLDDEEILEEEFPERNYAGEVYPAGEYTALIVELGDGTGDNWWCVLFPSLCLSAVRAEEAVEVGLTASQFGSITASSDEKSEDPPKYRLKFRFLELIEELFER